MCITQHKAKKHAATNGSNPRPNRCPLMASLHYLTCDFIVEQNGPDLLAYSHWSVDIWASIDVLTLTVTKHYCLISSTEVTNEIQCAN